MPASRGAQAGGRVESPGADRATRAATRRTCVAPRRGMPTAGRDGRTR
jgi:hypothetical protein